MKRLALFSLLLAALACEAARSQGHAWAEHRHLLVKPAPGKLPLGPRTYVPTGGRGRWSSGGSTGVIMTHAAQMSTGEFVGWSSSYMADLSKQYPHTSAVYNPATKSATFLLGPGDGIHAGHNAFCSAHIVTVEDQILIFGGHYNDKNWFHRYDHATGKVETSKLQSGRWYPGAATLPDGKILVVGGVEDSSAASYDTADRKGENPTHTVYDPATDTFSKDRTDMAAQLKAAFPIQTYPHVLIMPDGNVAVSAGSTLVKYRRVGDTFIRAFAYPNRPAAPWSYPQTGTGTLMPIAPPYNRLFFLAAGGSVKDRADENTPASNAVHMIELTGGAKAGWRQVGPAPYGRVMGDAVVLCDGTVAFFGGAARGIAGWSNTKTVYTYRNGGSWTCKARCSKADEYLYEPTILNPATGLFSKKGSLAPAMRPRLYHSVSVLMPDCRVLTAGSDVSNDNTAEFLAPPYLSKGPRPRILSAPDSFQPGADLGVNYESVDPVAKALLLRMSTVTHSMQFDARALWLELQDNAGGWVRIKTPPSSNLVPPGNYMLVLLTDKGVPSVAKVVKARPAQPGAAAAGLLFGGGAAR